MPNGGVKDIPPIVFQREYLAELRRLSRNDPTFSLRKEFEKKVRDLQSRRPLKEADQINLSFYYLRLGQTNEALELLRVLSRSSRSFMVFANLATAHQMLAASGDNPRVNLATARSYLRETLRAWPKEWPGWSQERLQWLRKAEEAQLKLASIRLVEVIKAGGAPKPATDVDALFPISFNFLEKDGKYRPGNSPKGEEGKLKGNEVAIVQQLLTWLPNDNRLYWLFGELLNASGDIAAAATILDDCVYNQNMTAPLLKDHRSILKQAAKDQAREHARNKPALPSFPEAPGETPAPAVDWSQLAVVGVIGVLIIAVLAYFQVREIRRRRHRKASGPTIRSSS
jgi:hypothetical protein